MTAMKNAPTQINTHHEKQVAKPICTVYFDGACPLCAKEITTYQTWRGADKIEWIDASRCEEIELGTQLNRQQALNKLHARDETGQLVSGAAAFIVMWRQLPALGWITPLLERRWVIALLDNLYHVFLKFRPLWRKPIGEKFDR
jgi:ubiquinone biosynthesis monooxygenase Coq7